MGSSLKAPQIDASNYWASYRAESEPCQFPRLGPSVDGPKRSMSLRVHSEHVQRLPQLSASDGAALPSLLRVAWSLLLRCYTGLDDVCFGYQETGLANVGDGNPRISKPLNGMLVARLRVDDTVSVIDTLEKAKREYISGLPYQSSVPSGTTEDSPLSGRQLFDTAVVLRSSPNIAASNKTIVTSQPLNVVLPKEVCVSASPSHPADYFHLLTQIIVQDTPAHQAFQWQLHHVSGMVEL